MWPQLAERFEGGALVDPVAMRMWVSELSAAEADEQAELIRRGPEPEARTAQATEHARRRAAKCRLRTPRVHLRPATG